MSRVDETFSRLAGLEPLYKVPVSRKRDKLKAAEAARLEMVRVRKTREHQSVLDDHMQVMSGLKRPQTAGMRDVQEARAEYITMTPETGEVSTGPVAYFLKSWKRDTDVLKAIKMAASGRRARVNGPQGMMTWGPASDAAVRTFQKRFGESKDSSARYELVVGSKLKRTLKSPKSAIALAKRIKGDVQVVDSQTGNVLYDSEE